MVIPPAWTDVWICPDPQGHVQAIGRDARGRLQYRYHPHWTEKRGRQKFAALVEFAVLWGWHAPALHEAAWRSAPVFAVEQASFLAAGLMLEAVNGKRLELR